VVPFIVVKRYFQLGLLSVVIFLAVLYAGDYLFVRLRQVDSKVGNPLATVGVYYETLLKNGQMQIYYQQAQPVTCVRSLFPHLGYSPCWYLRRTPMEPIS
jgi:hypothetical protein